MFKANRKLNENITTGTPKTHFNQNDCVYLEEYSVMYVTKGLKPEIKRVDINNDQYKLLVNSTREIDTYDYDRSKVAKERLYVRPISREEKIRIMKNKQKKEVVRKTRKHTKGTNYYDDVYPYLEMIRELRYKRTSYKKISEALKISLNTLFQYSNDYKELAIALGRDKKVC